MDLLTIIEVVLAVCAVLATGFAAFSAWTSKISAQAAGEAVKEARLAREASIAPRLVLEKAFSGLHLRSQDPTIPVPGVSYMTSSDPPRTPTFAITNHGGGPAMEIRVNFMLDDPNGDYSNSQRLRDLNLSISMEQDTDPPQDTAFLRLHRPDGSIEGIPLYQTWIEEIPSCAPGQMRAVRYPFHLMNVMFLRGLEAANCDPEDERTKPMTLTVRLEYNNVDGVYGQTQFRYEAHSFWNMDVDPILVYGGLRELPMYSKPAPASVS